MLCTAPDVHPLCFRHSIACAAWWPHNYESASRGQAVSAGAYIHKHTHLGKVGHKGHHFKRSQPVLAQLQLLQPADNALGSCLLVSSKQNLDYFAMPSSQGLSCWGHQQPQQPHPLPRLSDHPTHLDSPCSPSMAPMRLSSRHSSSRAVHASRPSMWLIWLSANDARRRLTSWLRFCVSGYVARRCHVSERTATG